jgi:hypothetical protein
MDLSKNLTKITLFPSIYAQVNGAKFDQNKENDIFWDVCLTQVTVQVTSKILALKHKLQ